MGEPPQNLLLRTLHRELHTPRLDDDDRLSRIKANVRRGFNADSGEMAKELEDQEVVDALGNEATAELRQISHALKRIDTGDYGKCLDCGDEISGKRLVANPVADLCIDCANEAERTHA